jgi:hypothetical protein
MYPTLSEQALPKLASSTLTEEMEGCYPVVLQSSSELMPMSSGFWPSLPFEPGYHFVASLCIREFSWFQSSFARTFSFAGITSHL